VSLYGVVNAKPTICGFYWYASGRKTKDGISSYNDLKIVYVSVDNNGNIVARVKGLGKIKPIETMHGEWWGPLEPPIYK